MAARSGYIGTGQFAVGSGDGGEPGSSFLLQSTLCPKGTTPGLGATLDSFQALGTKPLSVPSTWLPGQQMDLRPNADDAGVSGPLAESARALENLEESRVCNQTVPTSSFSRNMSSKLGLPGGGRFDHLLRPGNSAQLFRDLPHIFRDDPPIDCGKTNGRTCGLSNNFGDRYAQMVFSPDAIATTLQLASSFWDPLPRGNVMRIRVDARSRLNICGDTHGQLEDVLWMFYKYGMPSATNQYFFNGDIVDRGGHALEILLLLFCFKRDVPNSVYVQRGNHEDAQTNILFGFSSEVCCKLGDALGGQILLLCQNLVFPLMPLAALVSDDNSKSQFCIMHGGPPVDCGYSGQLLLEDNGDPRRPCLARMNRMRSSIQARDDPDCLTIFHLLWADPAVSAEEKARPNQRGNKYDEADMNAFCQVNNVICVVRSHEVPAELRGISQRHNGLCITVFSASNYTGVSNNRGGMLVCAGSPLTFECKEHWAPAWPMLAQCWQLQDSTQKEQAIDQWEAQFGIEPQRKFPSWMDGWEAHRGDASPAAARNFGSQTLDSKPLGFGTQNFGSQPLTPGRSVSSDSGGTGTAMPSWMTGWETQQGQSPRSDSGGIAQTQMQPLGSQGHSQAPGSQHKGSQSFTQPREHGHIDQSQKLSTQGQVDEKRLRSLSQSAASEQRSSQSAAAQQRKQYLMERIVEFKERFYEAFLAQDKGRAGSVPRSAWFDIMHSVLGPHCQGFLSKAVLEEFAMAVKVTDPIEYCRFLHRFQIRSDERKDAHADTLRTMTQVRYDLSDCSETEFRKLLDPNGDLLVTREEFLQFMLSSRVAIMPWQSAAMYETMALLTKESPLKLDSVITCLSMIGRSSIGSHQSSPTAQQIGQEMQALGQSIPSFFRRWDKLYGDGDGFLSLREIEKGLQVDLQSVKFSHEQVVALVQFMDSTGVANSRVSLIEFVRALTPHEVFSSLQKVMMKDMLKRVWIGKPLLLTFMAQCDDDHVNKVPVKKFKEGMEELNKHFQKQGRLPLSETQVNAICEIASGGCRDVAYASFLNSMHIEDTGMQ